MRVLFLEAGAAGPPAIKIGGRSAAAGRTDLPWLPPKPCQERIGTRLSFHRRDARATAWWEELIFKCHQAESLLYLCHETSTRHSGSVGGSGAPFIS